MSTTVHFKEEDRRRADFIKEQGDFPTRTEAVRAALKQMEKWVRKKELREKYSNQSPVDEEFEQLSGEAFDDLEEY